MNQKNPALVGGLLLLLFTPIVAYPANVTINVTSNLFSVSGTAYGMHTSVYDNQNGNAALPGRLIESGVNTLRYPGGGYADVFHWSVNKLTPWWGQAGNYGYQGPNTDFGSFVGLLSNAQSQAIITIDFGSGQLWDSGHTELVVPPTNAEPKEAAAWVAYANGDPSLYGTTNDITLGMDSLSNNWRTVGFWAKLRSSTQAQYQSWATNGLYDSTFNFLAINRPAPVGVKYWEIGNETFGSGYYGGGNGYSVNYAVPYPYTSHTRTGNSALSPATYGQQVKAFSQAMKAVDPTIKIGAVVSTPLGDYSWDSYNGQHWTPQVLAQCASNIDFIIAHWYPYNGTGDNGSGLLPLPAADIPSMINGTNSHTGTNSGLKDWINQYRPNDPTNVSIFITEFGYSGSVTNSVNGQPIIGPVTMLYDVDCYSTWMSYGVSNVCFLEMLTTPFLSGDSSLTRGETFYGIKTLHQMAQPGDTVVSSTSDTSNLRVQATRQQNGNVGVLLLNENMSSTQTVHVTISNAVLATSGTQYVFGAGNFIASQETPTSGPSSNSVSGVGNSFSVNIAPYTMMVYTIPILGGTIPTTLGLTSSANPSTYGTPVTFTATVQTNGVPLAGIGGETITFYNGTNQLGTGALNTIGQATLSTTATQLGAGTGSITGVYPGDATYYGSVNSPALSQVVTQATLTAGLTGSATKNYNGTGFATLIPGNYTLSGVFSGDTVTLNDPSKAAYDTRNVGTGKLVTASGLAISGASASNYVLSSTSASAAIGTINPTNITVTAAANSKNYDGTTTSATLPTITSGAVQFSDTAAFAQNYSDPNVGTGKTLIPSGIVSDGNGGSNYNYTFVSTANGTITAVAASIASGLAANDKVYDGTTIATINFANVVLNGVLVADQANVNLATNGCTATFAAPDVGTGISVTVTGLTLVGSAAGNYTFTQPTGLTANILPLQTPTVISITMTAGTAQVTFIGQFGQSYRVLATSDMTLPLNQWTVLTNGTFGSGPVTFTDNSPPPNRFYEIASP
ncbi:MAG TPA: YDG domain-containing protein [Verrucomicrobiae bacterium]|nr:YDG domain-containing protein [Verrucomicrobiae bacterium]